VSARNVADEVMRLKQELDGDIAVCASYQLGRALIEHDLVDELRLFVFPVVLGAGERLPGVTARRPARPTTRAGRRQVGPGWGYSPPSALFSAAYRSMAWNPFCMTVELMLGTSANLARSRIPPWGSVMNRTATCVCPAPAGLSVHSAVPRKSPSK
jgi:hypothetical protein